MLRGQNFLQFFQQMFPPAGYPYQPSFLRIECGKFLANAGTGADDNYFFGFADFLKFKYIVSKAKYGTHYNEKKKYADKFIAF